MMVGSIGSDANGSLFGKNGVFREDGSSTEGAAGRGTSRRSISKDTVRLIVVETA